MDERAGLLASPRLVVPAVDYRASFVEALREPGSEGGHLVALAAGRLAAPAEFARFVAALRAGADHPGSQDRYFAALLRLAPPQPPEGGFVPQTTLWWTAGREYLGRVSVRHRLTPQLLWEGGNIGYEVRPGARRRGHGTAMLAAALPLAAALGVDPARIDCDATNTASRRVIEKNGGVLDEERDGSLYFWVPTRRPG